MAVTEKPILDGRANERPSPAPAVNRGILLVSGRIVRAIEHSAVSRSAVGIKAIGLLQLPEAWVPKFFVVCGTETPDSKAIISAAAASGIEAGATVMVRSSGTNEGMNERGTLESRECLLVEAANTISALKLTPKIAAASREQCIHFLIQKRVITRAKGHLSNERRISRHARDWNFEVEGGSGERAAVAVRKWRDSSSSQSSPLQCGAKVTLPRSLRATAAWCGLIRAHLEWVWDGAVVWIVQLDLHHARPGINPGTLVASVNKTDAPESGLVVFKVIGAGDIEKYPKLKNANLYQSFGYAMPPFYVLADQHVIREIIETGFINKDLERDLGLLCRSPFVLRTDATGLKHEDRQMLPRSDELRSQGSAASWLVGAFREAMQRLGDAADIALIGHHFVPATASAWSLAMPGERRVRIESLWGIPEGVYFFAHDVYDVDTMDVDLENGSADRCELLYKRERYKGKFVAPNENGEWRVHQTAEGPDWSGSIKHQSWAKEIAWTSRKIAAAVGMPVVVMWFVDVHRSGSKHKVLPWYHESWKRTGGALRKAAPRKKYASSEVREVSSQQDWEEIKADIERGVKVERLILNPNDSAILRAPAFVDELAEIALARDIIVELSGGLLSHLFYMLSKNGCQVECVDLFGAEQEQVDFNKIVRDRIPSDIRGRGEHVEVVRLAGDALVEAIKRKLVEEVLEVSEAKNADAIADELADVQEVIHALAAAIGVSQKEVDEKQRRKRDKRGGFADGLMLLRTSLAPMVPVSTPEKPETQSRLIHRVEDLPRSEEDFHVDRRTDSSGTTERQLTIQMPAYLSEYSSGEHAFDLPTTSRVPHEMIFRAGLERTGSTLRLRIRLINAALQLELPLGDSDEPA